MLLARAVFDSHQDWDEPKDLQRGSVRGGASRLILVEICPAQPHPLHLMDPRQKNGSAGVGAGVSVQQGFFVGGSYRLLGELYGVTDGGHVHAVVRFYL